MNVVASGVFDMDLSTFTRTKDGREMALSRFARPHDLLERLCGYYADPFDLDAYNLHVLIFRVAGSRAGISSMNYQDEKTEPNIGRPLFDDALDASS